MLFDQLVKASRNYFPEIQIKYKNESSLMILLGRILGDSFIKDVSTTVGNSVYLPSSNFTKIHAISSCIILLHELVHLYDQKQVGQIIFVLSYLFPQILFLFVPFLLFIISWKIVVLVAILLLLPWPAIFRIHWEKRAYLSSIYVLYNLGKKLNFDPHLQSQKDIFVKSFTGLSYYYMWIFSDINVEFEQAVKSVQAGQRPFDDKVFDILDELMNNIEIR